MRYNGILISDIHFGVIDPDELKMELYEGFIKYIKDLKKIDFIVITGDYFDHKLYVNDKNSEIALSFMDDLVNISKKHKCPIRIVYGTESHEVNQYNLFSIYENDIDIDFKIIKTVTSEELLPNMKVLYIPEEYIYDKKEYYKEYFKDKYNYVFGHGTIQEILSIPIKNKKESKRKKVPMFTLGELDKVCKGQVYFGHYHINSNIEDKIFYIGSYTRWQHGEEGSKGFYHITFDIDKKEYKNKFIENTLAKKYNTYTFGYTSKVMNSENDLLEELDKLDRLNEAKDYDNVRYVFNIPENHPNPEFIINVLNERYKFNDSVKIKIVNGYVEKKKKVNKKKLNEIMGEYSMIFDKSIHIEDKIEYFIKKKWNRDIPIEKIKTYLNNGEA